jgi:hypothetical protein
MNREEVLHKLVKELLKFATSASEGSDKKKTEFLLGETLGGKDQSKDALSLALLEDASNAMSNACEGDLPTLFKEFRERLKGRNQDKGEYVFAFRKPRNSQSYLEGECVSHVSSLMGKKLRDVDAGIEKKTGKKLSALLDDMSNSTRGRRRIGAHTYNWVDTVKSVDEKEQSRKVVKKAMVQEITLGNNDYLIGSGYNKE